MRLAFLGPFDRFDPLYGRIDLQRWRNAETHSTDVPDSPAHRHCTLRCSVTVSPRHYITESPWLISKQIGWEQQIYNTDLPYWLRVFAVAMARSEPNLHTHMQPGELAKLLGKAHPDGTLKPVDRRDLSRYVKKAVALMLLDETSSPRCLVLPASTTACRRSGCNKPCDYHAGASSKLKRPIVIRQSVSTTVNRANSETASSQIGTSAVGQDIRQRRVNNPTAPGSRDILLLMPRQADEVSA
jgi:hypothetical protein